MFVILANSSVPEMRLNVTAENKDLISSLIWGFSCHRKPKGSENLGQV